MIQAKIRLHWSFAGCDNDHSRISLLNKMRENKYSEKSIKKVAETDLILIGEIVIDDKGNINVTRVRPIETCGAIDRQTAIQCTKLEEHGSNHVSIIPIPNGISIITWNEDNENNLIEAS